MSTDSATAKFLYTILKQLDLKSIDWNKVSSELNITNGHAARMRYSRFKQQMEGTSGKPRRPRQSAKARSAKSKHVKEDDEEKVSLGIKPEEGAPMEDHPRTPAMTHSNESMMGSTPCTPGDGIERVKPEPHEDDIGPVSASQGLHSPSLIFDASDVNLNLPEHVTGYTDLAGFTMAGNDDRPLQHHNLYHQRSMISGMNPSEMMGQDAHAMAMPDCQGQEFMQFGMDVGNQMGNHSHLSPQGVMMVKRECWNERY